MKSIFTGYVNLTEYKLLHSRTNYKTK